VRPAAARRFYSGVDEELDLMTQVRFATTIARKPQDVFDLVADITRNTEWAPGFTYAEKVTPGPVSLGSAFNTSAKGLGPMQIEIVEYERPTRLGFVGRARPVVMHHHFTLTPDNRGTRADQRIDVRPKGLLRLMSPLMAVMLKRMIQRNTADLKRYLEKATA
jgi:uncharacterized protein YndB with AHSA1/START domain